MTVDSSSDPADNDARASAWRRARLAAVCDVVEPWAHGTVYRATSFPDYFDYNVVLVDPDHRLTADDLIAAADDALAGLGHRRLEFGSPAADDPLRAEFERRGWQAQRLVWLRHGGSWPAEAAERVRVDRVDYDAVDDLRRAWQLEETPDLDVTGWFPQARAVAARLAADVFAAFDADRSVGFVEMTRVGRAAEITNAYVLPDWRGRGLGGALIRAAGATAAGEARELWICADDDDRAKLLYARLGFRPAGTALDFLRLPPGVPVARADDGASDGPTRRERVA